MSSAHDQDENLLMSLCTLFSQEVLQVPCILHPCTGQPRGQWPPCQPCGSPRCRRAAMLCEQLGLSLQQPGDEDRWWHFREGVGPGVATGGAPPARLPGTDGIALTIRRMERLRPQGWPWRQSPIHIPSAPWLSGLSFEPSGPRLAKKGQ